MFDFNDLSRCGTSELLLGGDWAASQNHSASLALIARQLATRVRRGERDALLEAARLLELGSDGAGELWYTATLGIRRRCRLPGPRRNDLASPAAQRT